MNSGYNLLLNSVRGSVVTSSRGIARIPFWEYHIRFDPHVGRKRPAQDVLDRFKRLNNGMWIRAIQGRRMKEYFKDEEFKKYSNNYVTCTKEECDMLDKTMTPFWLRKKYYADDPFEPYHVRHGVDSHRVDHKGRFIRERPKVLVDDITADTYLHDR